MLVDQRAHERIDSLDTAMKKHLEEHSAFETILAENTAMTKRIADNTDEMVALLKVVKNTKGFLATLKLIGVCLLWLAAIGGALSVLLSFALAAIKYGLQL